MLKLFSLLSLVLSSQYDSASITLSLITIDEYNKDNASPLRHTLQVSSEIVISDNSNLLVCVSIGNPPQKNYLRLSSKDPYTWIKSYRNYDVSKSTSGQTFSSELILLSQFNLNGTVTKDDITFGDLTISEYSFLMVNNTIDFNDDGILGLGKQDQNHLSMNFLEVLYQKKLITKKLFYIECEKKGKCSLNIGDYPTKLDLPSNKPYVHSHELLSKGKESPLNYLSTTLDAVFIQGENSLWNINEPVAFSYGSNSIYVSWDFFDYLTNTFFKEELATKSCMITTTDIFTYFVCKLQHIKPKPTLNFILGNWTYKLTFKDYILGDSIYHMIALIKNNKFNGWSFGNSFLKKYLTVFDLHLNKLSIYYNPKESSS